MLGGVSERAAASWSHPLCPQGSAVMSRYLRLACLLTLTLTLVLAACDSGVTARPAADAPTTAATHSTAPATAMATATASVLPTVTVDYQPCANYASKWAGIVRVGDLMLLPNFTDPDANLYQLPDGTPLKPLRVPPQSTTGQFPGWPTSTLGATTIYAAVCNASSSTPHMIQGARVKLTGFTAYGGQLSEWDYCAGIYARPAGVAPNNCDRGSSPIDEKLQATFAADAQPGADVTATQPAPPYQGFGPLPAVLPPGIIMYLNVQLTAPTASGTYTFAVALTTDGAMLPFTASTSMLLAPVAHVWNGQACSSSSMLAQIPPATNPPTPYICPVS
jgi:hypothetical protein